MLNYTEDAHRKSMSMFEIDEHLQALIRSSWGRIAWRWDTHGNRHSDQNSLAVALTKGHPAIGREKGTVAAGKSFSTQMERSMDTVLIIIALLIVGSAIWGWRGYRR